jgi:hypothetical protein
MSSVQPAPAKKIRAIIFSCHNQRYYDNTIEPKLERYHIETVKKIDPNKHSTTNLSDCDLVVLLLELMPSHHVQLIREQAKKAGKELVVLHRQVTDWERAFARQEDRRVAGAVKPISSAHDAEPRIPSKQQPPPPPSRPMPPPATRQPLAMWGKEAPSGAVPVAALPANDEGIEGEGISPEYAEWLGLVEEENKRLSERSRELEASWTKAAGEVEALVTKNVDLDKKNKELMERCRRAETEVDNLRKAHKGEMDEMRGLLRTAGEELDKTGKSVVSSIERAFEPLHQLWKQGVMEADEVLEKLFKVKK